MKRQNNGPQFKAGTFAAYKDIAMFGDRYAADFARATLAFPLDWFGTGYRSIVNGQPR
jgi:hypothetical protein